MNESGLNPSDFTLLIVDDTPGNIDVLRKTLEPEGYRVSVAPNGEIALKIVSRSLPDLILLDIMMPGIDGFETCRRLKADPASREVPVIFITARNETEDVVKGFLLGGVDYIIKPFRHEEVCARVRTHLRLRHLMKELETRNRELVDLNDLKNKFLGMASHDLRNPLASIRGFSEILLDDGDDLPQETREEFLKIIYSVSDNMSNMVNDLLDISVIESGKLELQLQPGSLKKLTEERIRIHETIAEKKKIAFHTSFADVPDFPFDPNRISQVLDNLIGNAVKFSPFDKKIFISLEREGEMAKVSVRDEGPGILPEDQKKLFQHFQKLSARPTGGETSSGLGLAIVKKMVEAHHGVVGVHSQAGSGATFSFKIPLGNL